MSSAVKSTKFYSGFTPLSIPSCSLWLDAADATTVTLSGSNVTAWNDKSGNGYNLSTVSNPVYTSSSVNGLNAITTNGTNNYLQNTTLSIAQPFTFFSVAKLRAASAATYQLVLQGTDASGSTAVVLFTPATSSVLTMWAGTAVTTSPTIAISSNVTHLYEAIFNNSSSVLGRNGTITTGLSPGTLALNGFRVGAEWNLGVFQAGEHCENIIYNRALSTSERQQVEGYLSYKWGTTSSMPLVHPYKAIKPATRAFQPVDISNCAFWLDAADATTVTLSGTKVTQWTDKISNYAFTQSTDGNRPSYAYNSTVKNNVLSFVRASSQYLVGPSNLPLGTNSISMFCVFSCADNTDGSIFNKGGAGGTGIQFWRASGLNSILLGPASPSVDRIDFVDSTTLGTFQVTGFVNNRATPLTSAYQNGTFQKSITADTTTNFTNSSLMGVGAYGNASGNFSPPYPGIYFNGNICEILIFLSALSTAERQQVEGYLANKWKTKPALISTQPFKVNNPLTVSFNPKQVSGCSLWLDATDTNTLTLSGSTVTTWNDKSGNGYSGTGVGSPTVVSNAINGLQVIQFNGSSQYINFGNILNMGTSPIYFFAVCKYDTTGDGTIVGKSSATSLAGRWFLLRQTGIMYAGIDATGSGVDATFADTSTTVQLLMGGWNRSAVFIFQNGIQKNTNTLSSTSNLSTTNPLWVGAYPNATATGPQSGLYLNGKVGEIIIYLSEISTSQRQQVEGYLARKWGLQSSLPSAHPYKKITP